MDSYPPAPQHSRHYSEGASSQTTLRDSTYSTYQYSPNPESYALLGLPSPASGKSGFVKPQALSDAGRFSEKPTGIHRLLNPYYFYPVVVLVVHVLLLALSWTFFSITLTRPVPLEPKLAVLANRNIQSVTLVVTLLASFIALISAVLYTRAIRYSLARFVVGGTSMYAITAATKMANSSPIKNFVRPTWTIAAVICALAVNSQTAGWATLMIPKRIEIESQMRGFELDLLSFGFRKLMEDNQAVVNADLFQRVMPITEASGSTAVSTHFNLPSILNLNQFSYTNSTLGIMPVSVQETNSRIVTVTGQTIPVNVEIDRVNEAPRGFPVRFSMTQQGFSAHVKCEQRVLDLNTRPSMRLRSQIDTLFNDPVTLAQLEVTCPTSNTPSFSDPVVTSANVDAVFAISCPVVQINGGRRWDLILTGSGIYKPINTTVCSIWPEINKVNVDYNDNSALFNSSFPSFVNGSISWDGEPAPWIGDFALSVFLRGLHIGQSPTGNSMGNTVLSFLATAHDPTDILTDIISEYVRGVLELSITLLRTAYTQNNNGLFPGGNSTIPESMRIATNGTYRATTIGWHQAKDTAIGVLIAPTFVSIVSILIIIATLVYKKGQVENPRTHFFDPGNILHIIAASSAGGIKTVFPPFHENNIENSAHVTVHLSPLDVPDSKPGFITTEVRDK